MAESVYTKQTWGDYDENKDFQTNVKEGRVATSEKMMHIEEGLYVANVPYTVGSVTTGETASVHINPDKSIDFVIPAGGGEANGGFGVSTVVPEDGKISVDSVTGENPGFILGPDGGIYEVIEKTEDGYYTVNKIEGVDIKGETGADGKSAYEIWKEQPGNENKTEEEFLASLKGEKGDKGDPGQGGSDDMGSFRGEAPTHVTKEM